MAKKEKKNPLAQIKIGSRILRDIITGLVISLFLCIVLTKLYDALCVQILAAGFSLPEFNYQDLFFTELSIAFLVISFVTLLANKTEDIYWVDVIQYRLVKPDYTSIVDISCYIFANMIISLFAYLVPTRWNLLLFSFVQIILLLGLLSMKLLMAFFGIDDLKIELEEEYEKALDFRKTVVLIHNYYDSNPYLVGYRTITLPNHRHYMQSANILGKCALLFVLITHFFRIYLKHAILGAFKSKEFSRIQLFSLKEFNENQHVDYQDGSIEQIYENIISGKKGPPITNLYILKQYIKMYKYSMRFDGNIQAHAEMMDSLYTNTINAIEHKEIQKSCEQICFMFRYKEYQHALSCMQFSLEHCPTIFVKEFTYLQKHSVDSANYMPMLNEMIVSLMKLPEYKIYKESSIIKPMFSFMSMRSIYLMPDILIRQYQHALKDNDQSGIESIYQTLASKCSTQIIKDEFLVGMVKADDSLKYHSYFLDAESSKNKIPQTMIDTLNNHMACIVENIGTQDKTHYISTMFDIAFNEYGSHTVCTLLNAHCLWMKTSIMDSFLKNCLQYLTEDNRNHLLQNLISICDIFKIYRLIENKYRSNELCEHDFIQLVDKLGECYDFMFDWNHEADKLPLAQEIKRSIIKPCAIVLSEKQCSIDGYTTFGKSRRFWMKVKMAKLAH